MSARDQGAKTVTDSVRTVPTANSRRISVTDVMGAPTANDRRCLILRYIQLGRGIRCLQRDSRGEPSITVIELRANTG